MAEAQDYWDWRKNLPPNATIFSSGAFPVTTQPVTEEGIPGTPNYVRPYVDPKPGTVVPPLTGPGYIPNVTSPGQPGVKMPSGVPIGDFGNPAPTQPIETDDERFKRKALELLQNKDFSGALSAIAKGATAHKIAPPPVFHVEAPQRMGGGKDLSQAGGGMMRQAIEEGGKFNLLAGRKPGEQGRYDILNKRQGGLKDLLAQLG
jgi:hypothetical protein